MVKTRGRGKISALLCFVAAILFFVVILTGCDLFSSDNACAHSYIDATCTESKKCSKCGEKSGLSLGHSYAAATCEEAKTCTRCQVTAGEALGHDFSDTLISVDAACEKAGYIGYECRRNGCTYVDTIENFAALEHDWHITVVIPTASTDGYDEHICSVCEKMFRDNYEYVLLNAGKHYGYDDLKLRSKTAVRRSFYETLFDESVIFHNTGNGILTDTGNGNVYVAFDIPMTQYNLTFDEAVEVWSTFCNDNPIFYWISNTVYALQTDGVAINFKVCVSDEYYRESVRITCNETIGVGITPYLSAVSGMTDKWEIVLTIQDMIIDAIDYAYDSFNNPETAAWAHNILGVFSETGAVCEGYAEAFQLILNKLGFDCIIASGTGISGGKSESHAWNLAKIYGEWYYFDLTWDDNFDRYEFFAKAAQTFETTHIAALPTGVGKYFLYALPDVKNTSDGNPATVTKDGESLGIFIFIEDAFAAMTDASSDYEFLPRAGSRSVDFPEITFPTVKSLKLCGFYYPTESSKFSPFYYYFSGDVILNSDLIIENVWMSGDGIIDLGGFTVTTCGREDAFIMMIAGSEGSEIIQTNPAVGKNTTRLYKNVMVERIIAINMHKKNNVVVIASITGVIAPDL